jgi:hypothetical protein
VRWLLRYALFAPAILASAGVFGFVSTASAIPWNCGPSKTMALLAGLAPALFPQTTGCFAVKLQKQTWWEALVMLQFVTSSFIL